MQGDEGLDRYRPSAAVLTRLRSVDFVAVVGPTAAGKDTLIGAAAQQDTRIHEVVGDTSRPPRPGEIDGVDLHFRSRSDMRSIMAKGSYVQIILHPSGDLYATSGAAYSTEGCSLMPILSSAIPVFRKLPFKRVRVLYLLPPDWDTWMERIRTHGLTDAQLTSRLAEARVSLSFALADPDVHFLISDDLRGVTGRAVAYIIQDVIDASGQAAARNLAAQLLETLIK